MNKSILPALSDDGLLEYLPLTSETLEGSLEVMRKSFFLDESASIAVKLPTNPDAFKELEELSVRNAEDGVSVIAVEKSSGLVVGVLFNKLQVKDSSNDSYFEDFVSKCKSPNAKALVQFMIDADAELDLFELCQVDCLLEMVFLAVLRTYRNRGIGVKLFELSLEIGRALFNANNVKTPLNKNDVLPIEPIPKGACVIFTSKVSQSIGRKLNMNIAVEISYEKFSFEGETFASRLGPNCPSTTVEYIKY